MYLRVYGYIPNKRYGEVMEYITNLEKDEAAKILAFLKKLDEQGAKFLVEYGSIYQTKKIRDILYEIKIDKNRFMYCYYENNKVYILSAFRKDSQATRKYEINKAYKRAKEILEKY